MRVQLSLPDTILYITELTIQVGDLNYGNHLANDAVLRITHEVRMRWLATGGFSELDVGGVGLIMADAMVQYLTQGFYGDRLICQVAIGECSRCGFELYTQLMRQADQSVIAIVKVGMVCFDYSTQKIAPIPQNLRQLLGVNLA